MRLSIACRGTRDAEPALDEEVLAVDVGGLVGGKERDGGGDLLGGADPAGGEGGANNRSGLVGGLGRRAGVSM